MRSSHLISALLFGTLLAGLSGSASALPNTSSTGKSCESTGTTTRTGKDQTGKSWTCTWDYCTWSECSTSGGTLSNCVKKTEYSNPQNCVAALKGSGKLMPGLRNLDKNMMKKQ